jgi:hypothetical protein
MIKTAVGNQYLTDEVIQRHSSFQSRELFSRPLVGTYPHSIYPLERLIAHFQPGQIFPEKIDPVSWFNYYEESWNTHGLLWGELISWTSPLNGFPWMEAIAGCPIHVSPESRSVWADPLPAFNTNIEISLSPQNPWFELLIEATKSLVVLADGRFPIASGIMRGITDLLAAILGSTNFYLAIHDEPKTLSRLARQLADLWVDVVQAQYEIIPEFHGGHVNAGIWSLGCSPVYQEDASALISGEAYEQIVGPIARDVMRSFKNPILHLHSVGLHILPSFLIMDQPPIIEVNIDPAGPSIKGLLPVFKQIQAATPLELFGDEAVIQKCIDGLPANALACLIQALEAEVAND